MNPPRDLADSAAPILKEGNRRRVHGAQSLKSDRLKMVRMGKVCIFGRLSQNTDEAVLLLLLLLLRSGATVSQNVRFLYQLFTAKSESRRLSFKK